MRVRIILGAICAGLLLSTAGFVAPAQAAGSCYVHAVSPKYEDLTRGWVVEGHGGLSCPGRNLVQLATTLQVELVSGRTVVFSKTPGQATAAADSTTTYETGNRPAEGACVYGARPMRTQAIPSLPQGETAAYSNWVNLFCPADNLPYWELIPPL